MKPRQDVIRKVGGTPFVIVQRDGGYWLHSKRCAHRWFARENDARKHALAISPRSKKLQAMLDNTTSITFAAHTPGVWVAEYFVSLHIADPGETP
jgi:hypothetical protein